ncbi:hypothetical protein [Apilactobacillus xinyiensis]|uniref:hypothetical protein n=1 Tax=Apilactobacillus xinyiensis TaxID=2841032 RepID=UPI001C7DDDBC|nr:hypothetical protein [Apilactobacillus xinyiensis]MCL0312269.1 hypothetical protein [Apilactobacillus xinyiensis]
MKNINKKSLLIAPMAMIILGGSLNLTHAKANEINWSQQEELKNSQERQNNFKNTYNDASLELLASQFEEKLSNQAKKSINLINEHYNDIQKQIDSKNSEKAFFENFDSNTNDRKEILKFCEMISSTNPYSNLSGLSKSQQKNLDTYTHNLTTIPNVDTKKLIEQSRNIILTNYKPKIEELNVRYNDDSLRKNIDKLKYYSDKALEASKLYKNKYNSMLNSKGLSREVFNDISNAHNDCLFLETVRGFEYEDEFSDDDFKFNEIYNRMSEIFDNKTNTNNDKDSKQNTQQTDKSSTVIIQNGSDNNQASIDYLKQELSNNKNEINNLKEQINSLKKSINNNKAKKLTKKTKKKITHKKHVKKQSHKKINKKH